MHDLGRITLITGSTLFLVWIGFVFVLWELAAIRRQLKDMNRGK